MSRLYNVICYWWERLSFQLYIDVTEKYSEHLKHELAEDKSKKEISNLKSFLRFKK